MKTRPTCAHIALSIVMATAIVGSAKADVQMSEAVLLGTGPQPSGVAAGDFNRDGFADLAVTVDAPDRVQIYFGNGTGYGAAVNYQVGSGVGAGSIIASDVDGDLDADLLVALQNSASVRVLTNNGAGVFALGQLVATGSNPRSLAQGNFGGSGLNDYVSVNRDSNSVTVLMNSAGTLSAASVAVGTDPRAAAIADIDRDGDLDLAVTNSDDRNVQVLLNNGAGTFVSGGTFGVHFGEKASGIAAGDLDGDNDADLMVSFDRNGTTGMLGVMLNNGTGGYSNAGSFLTGGQNPDQIVLADLDGDGRLDAIVNNQDTGTVAFLPGLGGATFGAAIVRNSGADPTGVTGADLDGDGDIDIAVPNRSSNNVALFENLAPAAFQFFGPGSFTLVRGRQVSGDLGSLQTSDDSSLVVSIGLVLNGAEAPVQVRLDGTAPTATPNELRFKIESKGSLTGISQQVQLFNWQTNAYETLDTRTIGTLDGIVEVSVPTNAARFVQQGTNAVRALAKYKVNSPSFSAWSISIDLAQWSSR
ncbi:MAG: hypothetical protein HONBIEJF_02688 [Fimbriimonadaceae bacterium]|nr:hypothetical protein [Fimbriimonadaceae bacterium]